MNRKPFTIARIVILVLVILVSAPGPVTQAQWSQGWTGLSTQPLTPAGSGFTYQGRLKNGTVPANGQYDFQFTMYDALAGGTLVAGPISQANQTVSEGLFTVTLDFGSTAFQGDARWLAIAVRPTGGGGYTTLTPRQPITPAPYALFAQDTPPYDNVVVVAKSGGDFTTVTSALNSITDNATNNRYLVWVAPGTYTETVTMKPWVDIEGSGELTTKITSPGSFALNTGTLLGAAEAQLRFLTVENTGGNIYATAIYIPALPEPFSLLHVTANSRNGAETNNYGVYNNGSSPKITEVVTNVFGGTGSDNYGLYSLGGHIELKNVTAYAQGGDTSTSTGVYIGGAQLPTLTDVTATGASDGTSYGVYIDDNSAPTILNMTATGTGGASYNYGVYNLGSSLTKMTNVTATARGDASAYNFGIYNYDITSFPMLNVTVNVSSSALGNYGVYNLGASPRMTNLTVTTSGGANNYGVWNDSSQGSHTVLIDNSTITGSTNTIYNRVGNTTRVGSTKLSGGPVSLGGIVTCAGVHDENYVFFPSTCP